MIRKGAWPVPKKQPLISSSAQLQMLVDDAAAFSRRRLPPRLWRCSNHPRYRRWQLPVVEDVEADRAAVWILVAQATPAPPRMDRGSGQGGQVRSPFPQGRRRGSGPGISGETGRRRGRVRGARRCRTGLAGRTPRWPAEADNRRRIFAPFSRGSVSGPSP